MSTHERSCASQTGAGSLISSTAPRTGAVSDSETGSFDRLYVALAWEHGRWRSRDR